MSRHILSGIGGFPAGLKKQGLIAVSEIEGAHHLGAAYKRGFADELRVRPLMDRVP